MLEHHRDAERTGLRGAGDLHRTAVDAQFAGIGADNAVDHLHQRALARAVFAEHGDDLARHHVERYAVVRAYCTVVLRNAVEAQARNDRLHRRRGGGVRPGDANG